ncbi:MAG: hypothetical protein WD848_13470, partial [Dehalococcoidia bacterium]
TDFERLGIAHGFGVNPNGRMHAMINWTRLTMLHHGALIQLAEKQNQIEQHLSALATTTTSPSPQCRLDRSGET